MFERKTYLEGPNLSSQKNPVNTYAYGTGPWKIVCKAMYQQTYFLFVIIIADLFHIYACSFIAFCFCDFFLAEYLW